MAEIDPSPETLQSTPSMSFFSRVLGVFIEPGETFEDIARNPGWMAPLGLLVLASVVFTETMLAKIGMARIIIHSLQQNGQAARMDPAQLNQAVQRGAAFAGIIVQVMGVVGVPIFLLVIAGFGLLALNVFFGDKASFKKVFSVACYADMPAVVGIIMGIAVMIFGDPESFNPRSPAPTNLGFFLNPLTTSHAFMALANSMDFIIVWFLILLAIGLSRVSQKKVASGSIFMTYVGAWLLVIIAKVGFALLSGS
jgi:hypothetical protein